MPHLALLRHGQSEYNALGLWTGLTDIALNDDGIREAHEAADALRDVRFDIGFTSALKRAQEYLGGQIEARLNTMRWLAHVDESDEHRG